MANEGEGIVGDVRAGQGSFCLDRSIAIAGEGAKCFLCIRADSEGTGAEIVMVHISGKVYP